MWNMLMSWLFSREGLLPIFVEEYFYDSSIYDRWDLAMAVQARLSLGGKVDHDMLAASPGQFKTLYLLSTYIAAYARRHQDEPLLFSAESELKASMKRAFKRRRIFVFHFMTHFGRPQVKTSTYFRAFWRFRHLEAIIAPDFLKQSEDYEKGTTALVALVNGVLKDAYDLINRYSEYDFFATNCPYLKRRNIIERSRESEEFIAPFMLKSKVEYYDDDDCDDDYEDDG